MSEPELARLTVRAEPGVSVTVLNSELEPVASGTGTFQAHLTPGLYELQLLAGHALNRHVLRLGPKGASFKAPAVDFPSPAPVSPNEADDVVGAEAARLSKRPANRLGRGAQLLVVVSDDAPVARANAAAGLTLRSLEGDLVADLEELGKRSAAGKQPVWSISCLELDPGPYVLRVATGHATLEQSVILVGDWQTQVFLDRKSWGHAPARRRASLPDASVLMARKSDGFDPRRPDLRLTELARIALLDRRAILGERDIHDLVHGKWQNPMLGLYGANVLLATTSTGIGELDTIRRNLRRLLGDHPDVAALDVRAEERHEPVEVPPMLRVSWDALVSGTAERPELVPADSLPGRIADHLFGAGVWLTWQTKARTAKASAEPVEIGALAERLDELAAALAELPVVKGARKSRARRTAALSPVGQSVVAFACGLAREAQSGTRLELSERDVVEALGAPQAVIASAVRAAFGNFGLKTR